jgi:hypothetical protein
MVNCSSPTSAQSAGYPHSISNRKESKPEISLSCSVVDVQIRDDGNP